MLNRLLTASLLALVIFQLGFSIYYSTLIVKLNQTFHLTQKQYQQSLEENQQLELNYVSRLTQNHGITSN